MLNNADEKYLEQRYHALVRSCPSCHGSGISCPCQDQFQFEYRLATAHVPIKFRTFSMEQIVSPEVLPAKARVMTYIQELSQRKGRGCGLFLWSENSGTAKSAMGAIILQAAIRHGYSAYYTTLDECVSLATQGWYDAEKKDEFVHQILNTDFLMIDDIGGMEIKTSKNHEIIESTFTVAFKQRCDSMLPTIMTSNIIPDEIERRYGQRLYSIIREHLEMVECKGPDYRQLMASDQEPKR